MDEERKLYLYAILRKAKVSNSIVSKIENEYIVNSEELLLLEILTKFDYSLSKKNIVKLSENNFVEAIRIIRLHDLNYVHEWIDLIQKNILLIESHDHYLHLRKILEASNSNFGKIITPLLQSKEKDSRSSVINTLGNLKQKHDYINEFKMGLEDSELSVVYQALGALYECKDKSLLIYNKRVLDRLSNRKEHLENLTFDSLKRNLNLFGITIEQLEKSDLNLVDKKNWFKF